MSLQRVPSGQDLLVHHGVTSTHELDDLNGLDRSHAKTEPYRANASDHRQLLPASNWLLLALMRPSSRRPHDPTDGPKRLPVRTRRRPRGTSLSSPSTSRIYSQCITACHHVPRRHVTPARATPCRNRRAPMIRCRPRSSVPCTSHLPALHSAQISRCTQTPTGGVAHLCGFR